MPQADKMISKSVWKMCVRVRTGSEMKLVVAAQSNVKVESGRNRDKLSSAPGSSSLSVFLSPAAIKIGHSRFSDWLISVAEIWIFPIEKVPSEFRAAISISTRLFAALIVLSQSSADLEIVCRLKPWNRPKLFLKLSLQASAGAQLDPMTGESFDLTQEGLENPELNADTQTQTLV